MFEGRHIDYRSSKVDTSITDLRRSTHQSSVFEGQHIHLRRSTHRSSKVDTSISEGRHIVTSIFEGRHESGCEAAVHALNNLFNHPCCEAAIQVDAINAFNCLNRKVALRNILHLCPSLAKILINTYRNEINLHIGGETILSQEGITQGDPLAMAMYAIGTAPLIRALSKESVKQVWYADDASAAGGIKELRRWWDLLVRIGPNYGYYPNACETRLPTLGTDSLQRIWSVDHFRRKETSWCCNWH